VTPHGVLKAKDLLSASHRHGNKKSNSWLGSAAFRCWKQCKEPALLSAWPGRTCVPGLTGLAWQELRVGSTQKTCVTRCVALELSITIDTEHICLSATCAHIDNMFVKPFFYGSSSKQNPALCSRWRAGIKQHSITTPVDGTCILFPHKLLTSLSLSGWCANVPGEAFLSNNQQIECKPVVVDKKKQNKSCNYEWGCLRRHSICSCSVAVVQLMCQDESRLVPRTEKKRALPTAVPILRTRCLTNGDIVTCP